MPQSAASSALPTAAMISSSLSLFISHQIETIGDCYLCVTGCPRPQDKHALMISRFAGDCILAMDKLIRTKLAKKLGEDTKDLKLRVGLHSGTVTAGVLRGDRARFQLFGDVSFVVTEE